ncbi:MAG: response regulator [Pegethrix bostrychoides GSE-TBD4-15B]|jgi:DNA-binding response OmpR family regulator|uniref:Response regulator n=1 Tax=Pegethrix bostrychoides GSE-TBD4-15B TaxID=2839662 RepID=A0A951PEJ3_9CYAN|nr:response regulator [Pegethrix bostrychoides GSE-TBD4-15B]
MKILLVEDDPTLIKLLTQSLAAERYVLDIVEDGEQGWLYGSTFEYDLVILDIMLPKLNGICLCQRFRAEGYSFPILLLTAQASSSAKVQGFDAGADDYVVKPFDQAELLARLRALLRRCSASPLPILSWGELRLNPGTCEVSYSDQLLRLTTKEYDLLEMLLRQSHHVFSIDEILDRLWSSEAFPAEATVRSHLRRLRQKLTEAGAPPDLIGTLHGRGYYLNPPPQQSGLTGNPNSQAAYLAFLNQTWRSTKPRCLEQLQALSQATQGSQAHILHQLAGTLGIFGLLPEMQIARRLEDYLSRAEMGAEIEIEAEIEAEPIARLVRQLQQAIGQIETVQVPPASSEMTLPAPARNAQRA